MALKILRVISRLNTGGPTRHVILLDAGLRSFGHQTTLVYGAVAAGEASMERLAGEYGVPAIKVPSLGRSLRAFEDLRALARLTSIIFTKRPDVVHTHTSKAGMVGRLAALFYNCTRPRRRRCAVVHTFHGHVFDGYFPPSVNRIVRSIERALAGLTDRIITISPRQRFDIVTRYEIAAETKVTIIPLGIDLSHLLQVGAQSPNLRRELAIADDDVVIGFVGRLVPIKDPETLIGAFARARVRMGRGTLVIAGGGPLRPRLERLAGELGVEPHVRFLGWTDRLPELYATIDLCALSSLNEGTPVALIEAMAAGKAVVATAVGGVPDLVEDGVQGRLVAARDVDGLAAALVQLSADPESRSRLGAAGRARVATAYSHERLVADVEELYRAVVREKQGTRGGNEAAGPGRR